MHADFYAVIKAVLCTGVARLWRGWAGGVSPEAVLVPPLSISVLYPFCTASIYYYMTLL